MTQEDKMLLIKDLSSRLPYAVHVQHISGVSCILHDISISIYHKYDKNDNLLLRYNYITGTKPTVYISKTDNGKCDIEIKNVGI